MKEYLYSLYILSDGIWEAEINGGVCDASSPSDARLSILLHDMCNAKRSLEDRAWDHQVYDLWAVRLVQLPQHTGTMVFYWNPHAQKWTGSPGKLPDLQKGY